MVKQIVVGATLFIYLRGFSFSINIANFEAFLSVFMLTKNLFFLKSGNILSMTKMFIFPARLEKLVISLTKKIDIHSIHITIV